MKCSNGQLNISREDCTVICKPRYDYINSFILDYIAYSIHVSEVGGFYWYIIALQDLLRATEYTGASGVYAIRYYVNGQLSPDNHR